MGEEIIVGLFDFLKKKQGKVSKHVDYQLASSLFRTGKVLLKNWKWTYQM